MTTLGMLVLGGGSTTILGVVTAIATTVRHDRIRNAAWEAHRTGRAVITPAPRPQRRELSAPAKTQAIESGPPPAQRPREKQRPRENTRIRLEDGRFGTISAVVPTEPGMLRVHLEMDDGSRGHIDTPDPAPAPRPAPARPAPTREPATSPVPAPARPVTIRTTVIGTGPAPVVPAPTAGETARPRTPAPGGAPTVSLGGFSIPITKPGGRA